MNGTEIITFLSNNFPTVMSAVGAITGSIFTAIFLRHNTAAKEFEKIKAGQLKEAADELLKSGKMTYTEYYKANNFLSVAKKADKLYSEMHKEQVTEKYDFDWFVRFYEAVGNISNEQMQDIWARILAGEINVPGSFSLRAIDLIKNIGQIDAELFERVCLYAMRTSRHIFLPNYELYLDTFGINYSDVMRLDELGLINSNGLLVLSIQVQNTESLLFNNGNLAITLKSKGNNASKFEVKQFPLTDVGRELFSILKISTPDECYSIFAKELSKNKNIAVALHHVLMVQGNQITFERTNLLDQNDDLNDADMNS